jgi:hypothetical protein
LKLPHTGAAVRSINQLQSDDDQQGTIKTFNAIYGDTHQQRKKACGCFRN